MGKPIFKRRRRVLQILLMQTVPLCSPLQMYYYKILKNEYNFPSPSQYVSLLRCLEKSFSVHPLEDHENFP